MRSYQIVVLLALLVVLGSIVGYRVGYGIGSTGGQRKPWLVWVWARGVTADFPPSR